VAEHKPDISYLPVADLHRLVAAGDNHYRGLAIATSKFTGTTHLPSVLVVRKDDPATNLNDLAGAKYGYINKSCSSSYFPPAILLARQGKTLDEFFEIVPTSDILWSWFVRTPVAESADEASTASQTRLSSSFNRLIQRNFSCGSCN
jgi:ABC-type phosphate/phosphonate transport system substrate-binding protein